MNDIRNFFTVVFLIACVCVGALRIGECFAYFVFDRIERIAYRLLALHLKRKYRNRSKKQKDKSDTL